MTDPIFGFFFNAIGLCVSNERLGMRNRGRNGPLDPTIGGYGPRNVLGILILYPNTMLLTSRTWNKYKTGSTHSTVSGDRPDKIACSESMPLITVHLTRHFEVPLLRRRLSQQHNRTTQRPRYMYCISDCSDAEALCTVFGITIERNTAAGDSGTIALVWACYRARS